MAKNGHKLPKSTLKGRPGGSSRLVAALDVGSTQVTCFIARADGGFGIHVLGTGYRLSPGVRSGTIVDMEETESAIRAAVHQAESLAQETVDEVIVNLSAGAPKTQIIELDAHIEGQRISEAEVGQLLNEAARRIDAADREVVHAFPACYSIDGVMGVRDPAGMYGDNLSVALHAVTAAPGPLRNLVACVENAHLVPAQVVMSPYAAALATLVEDEKELGAACIDIGGGVTSVAVFARKAMVYTDIIPIGSGAITEDIAREMLTPIDRAERIKILYGSAITAGIDADETIDVMPLGEDGSDPERVRRVPRSAVTETINRRATTILEAARESLRESGFDRVSGRRVVLTGGGSQLAGMAELAEEVLGKQVRIGRPEGIHGLPESARGPGFATCAGLLAFSGRAPMEVGTLGSYRGIQVPEAGGIVRMGRWLRENF